MSKIGTAKQLSKDAHDTYETFNKMRNATESAADELKFLASPVSVRFKLTDGVVTVYIGSIEMKEEAALVLARGLLAVLEEESCDTAG